MQTVATFLTILDVAGLLQCSYLLVILDHL